MLNSACVFEAVTEQTVRQQTRTFYVTLVVVVFCSSVGSVAWLEMVRESYSLEITVVIALKRCVWV